MINKSLEKLYKDMAITNFVGEVIMDYLEAEKTCKKIIELRTKRLELQGEINNLVNELSDYLTQQGKDRLKIGKYSLEQVKRVRRDMDFAFLDLLQQKGVIPLDKMKKTEYYRLLITTSQNMKLVGNKFVRE